MSEFENNETSHIVMDDSSLNNAKVKVFGVGGAGGNTVNRMVKMTIEGVEYYAVNTDAKALELSLADHKIQIGQKVTKALGAGMKPEVGCKAAEENIEELRDAMAGADLVFITAGMGGGTGTGAAPVVGKVARELGILTVAVVSKPFGYEGKRRGTLAAEGIKELRASVDTMIVVDNQKLLSLVQNTDKTLTLDGSFRLADEILGNAVRSICDIMFRHGLIHVDFADIKTVMTNGGSALMGTGIAEGEGRGIKAVDLALSSPLLEDINVDGATGVLVNVSHGENFTMLEYSEAMEHIHEAVSDKNDPNIIIGDILLPELGDKVYITIIATGCGNPAPQIPTPMFTMGSIPQVQAKSCELVNTIGAPVSAQVAAQPMPQAAPQVAAQTVSQPVSAKPRPTSMNFAALARGTMAMPSFDASARTVPMPSVAPAQPSVYASSAFNAQAPAYEEELVMTATANLPETREMPEVAEEDTLSCGNFETPAFSRQQATIEPVVNSAPVSHVDPRTLKYPEDSLKTNGIDYDMPAFLRMSRNDDF
ncbi:MAG: cell division protein FtsZ [Fibrobacter sp.]|nr:cell division protein FtsZ [Fibrobacter sp.]